MYGLIGSIKAVPGKRDELAATIGAGSKQMPGCLSYVVALDKSDPQLIWITEVWDSKESHEASLGLPVVQAAIAKARPLIAGFASHAETVPLAGLS
jgi:quinol monooxygenase YgiN